MKPAEKTEVILSMLRPQKRKQSALYGALSGLGNEPDKAKTIYGRTSESFKEMREDLHFLAGVLTVLPRLDLPRGTQFVDEGGKLLRDAYTFGNSCNASVRSIRKMRVFGEKILRLLAKIEKEASQ